MWSYLPRETSSWLALSHDAHGLHSANHWPRCSSWRCRWRRTFLWLLPSPRCLRRLPPSWKRSPPGAARGRSPGQPAGSSPPPQRHPQDRERTHPPAWRGSEGSVSGVCPRWTPTSQAVPARLHRCRKYTNSLSRMLPPICSRWAQRNIKERRVNKRIQQIKLT